MLNIIPIAMLVATLGADPEPLPTPSADTISQNEPSSNLPDES